MNSLGWWFAATLVLVFTTIQSFLSTTLHDLFIGTGLLILMWLAYFGFTAYVVGSDPTIRRFMLGFNSKDDDE